MEHLSRQSANSAELRRPTAQHDARGQAAQARLVELLDDQLEGLLQARLDDLAHLTPRDWPAIAGVKGRNVNCPIVLEQLRQRVPMPNFDLFGRREWRAQSDGQVVADLKAADRQHRGKYQGALDEDADVGRTTANVYERDADLPLRFREHGFAGRDRLKHE